MDLHPASSDQHRLYAHILKEEGWTRAYQKRCDPNDWKKSGKSGW